MKASHLHHEIISIDGGISICQGVERYDWRERFREAGTAEVELVGQCAPDLLQRRFQSADQE